MRTNQTTNKRIHQIRMLSNQDQIQTQMPMRRHLFDMLRR
ncbi:hypothetical protein O166_00175 [Pseudogulbenkiania ferrooxidans EGD-HP2]|uniref:Uncharacterized protein n=1 Tax=Pseudogulbenkiania ferrooxidans EGD-HP2 TaxID=1388764 RepID=A0ABN0N935_9NEIS|nr:hypothetical protein O166_00175 [Pseudogulbenkiania ferrooxidans EGD-HP2]